MLNRPLADALPVWAKKTAHGFELRVKVVPGASASEIVGLLGNRLKIRVAAPPEHGKANREVIKLLEKWLGVKPVLLISGDTNPEKTFLVERLG